MYQIITSDFSEETLLWYIDVEVAKRIPTISNTQNRQKLTNKVLEIRQRHGLQVHPTDNGPCMPANVSDCLNYNATSPTFLNFDTRLLFGTYIAFLSLLY